MATRTQVSDAHRDGHKNGVDGKSEYGFFQFPSTDKDVRTAHREGYNDGRERRAEIEAERKNK